MWFVQKVTKHPWEPVKYEENYPRMDVIGRKDYQLMAVQKWLYSYHSQLKVINWKVYHNGHKEQNHWIKSHFLMIYKVSYSKVSIAQHDKWTEYQQDPFPIKSIFANDTW